jgi:hypothetical protein
VDRSSRIQELDPHSWKVLRKWDKNVPGVELCGSSSLASMTHGGLKCLASQWKRRSAFQAPSEYGDVLTPPFFSRCEIH